MTPQVLGEEREGIEVEGLADLDGLDEGEQSLSRLVLAHEGLMGSQLLGEIRLAETDPGTAVAQESAQRLLIR